MSAHVESLRQQLRDTKREVQNLIVMGLQPGLSRERAELIGNLERSARAEVTLRQKALDYQLSLEKEKK